MRQTLNVLRVLALILLGIVAADHFGRFGWFGEQIGLAFALIGVLLFVTSFLQARHYAKFPEDVENTLFAGLDWRLRMLPIWVWVIGSAVAMITTLSAFVSYMAGFDWFGAFDVETCVLFLLLMFFSLHYLRHRR